MQKQLNLLLDETVRTSHSDYDQLIRYNVKQIMFDFYHIQILQGDVLNRFKAHLPFIGHVQIASVPERAEPDRGELNYVNLISAIYEAGYQGYVGAEYKPIMDTDSGLGWLASY